ncbi:hypothetical protein LTR85_012162 [Meristemomyces frigidus]|nr:hypothetical protein LTR85_012162 [Meristemomyces frigidus]
MAQDTSGDATAATVVPDPNTNDASMQKEKTFRFFDLPRELRNLVYQELTASRRRRWKNNKVHEYEGHNFVGLTAFCLPESRLVSRQFKSEYDEEVFQYAHMTIHLDLKPGYLSFQWSLLEQWRSNDLFRMHRHVLLSLDPDLWKKGDWDGALRATMQMIPEVVAALPSLRTFTVQFDLFSALHFDEAVMEFGVQPLDFFTADLFPRQTLDKDSRRNIHFDRWILIDNSLFSVNKDVVPGLDATYDWRRVESQNGITYRATPAADPDYGWHGLELTTVSVADPEVVKTAILQEDVGAESCGTASDDNSGQAEADGGVEGDEDDDWEDIDDGVDI